MTPDERRRELVDDFIAQGFSPAAADEAADVELGGDGDVQPLDEDARRPDVPTLMTGPGEPPAID